MIMLLFGWQTERLTDKVNRVKVREGQTNSQRGLPWRSALWWYTQGFVSQSSLAPCRTQRWDPHPRSSDRCPGCRAQTTTQTSDVRLILFLWFYVMIYLSYWRAKGKDVSMDLNTLYIDALHEAVSCWIILGNKHFSILINYLISYWVIT